jgi:hypothetical protein
MENTVCAYSKFIDGLEKVKDLENMFSRLAEMEIQNQGNLSRIVEESLPEIHNSNEKKMMDAFIQNFQMQIKQRKKIGQLIHFRICSALKSFLEKEIPKAADLKTSIFKEFKGICDIVSKLDQSKTKCLTFLRSSSKIDILKQIEACREFNSERMLANQNIALIYRDRLNELIFQLQKSEEKRISTVLEAFEAFAKIQTEVHSSTLSFIEKMIEIPSSIETSKEEFLSLWTKTDQKKAEFIPYDLSINLEDTAQELISSEDEGDEEIRKEMESDLQSKPGNLNRNSTSHRAKYQSRTFSEQSN